MRRNRSLPRVDFPQPDFPDDPQGLAVGDGDADPVDRPHRANAVVRPVALGELVSLEKRGHGTGYQQAAF